MAHSKNSPKLYAKRAGYTSGSHQRWTGSQWNGTNGVPRPNARRSDRPGDPEQRAKRDERVLDAHNVAHRCAHCAKPVGETAAKRAPYRRTA